MNITKYHWELRGKVSPFATLSVEGDRHLPSWTGYTCHHFTLSSWLLVIHIIHLSFSYPLAQVYLRVHISPMSHTLSFILDSMPLFSHLRFQPGLKATLIPYVWRFTWYPIVHINAFFSFIHSCPIMPNTSNILLLTP